MWRQGNHKAEVTVEPVRGPQRRRTMPKPLLRFVAGALLAGFTCLTACGSSDAVAYLTETQRTRGEQVDGVWLSQRLIDYLPNVSVEGLATGPVPDTVVVGEIVAAEKGAAFKLPNGEPPNGAPNDGQIRVPFESAEADWKTIHANVEVRENLGEDPQESRFVTVGFVIHSSIDAELFMRGLLGLGTAVFFASGDSPVFDYDKDVNGIDGEGTMVATVADDGTLALPFMTEAFAAQFLSDSPDLDALIAAAHSPARTIAGPNGGG